MSLKVVATPIGNPGDITLRAIEALKAAEVVIGEERREVSTLLKRIGATTAEIRLLNEHSGDDDIKELLELCRDQDVALVSDAGTPGFCDPGARLVAACRRERIPVTALPGASSLMCLLALSGGQSQEQKRDQKVGPKVGQKIDPKIDQIREFVFRGFLPAERDARAQALRQLANERRPIVLMDTPYRLGKLLEELAALYPTRKALIGTNLTLENELVLEDTLAALAPRFAGQKAEFILLLYPRECLESQPGDQTAKQILHRTASQRDSQGRRFPARSSGKSRFDKRQKKR
jgi:16S rRNA (cytidine1402-2'-O)-methyltransferase